MSATSDDLIRPVTAAVRQVPSASRYRVALSGGLDSVVLLRACSDVGLAPLEAVHVHHGLSVHADEWAAHCERLCRDLDIPLTVVPVKVVAAGQGIEAAAREARYAVFERILQAGDVLLMAHHADDQLETLLLRLCKGGQPEELTGIPRERPLGAGTVYRPFLSLRRAQLSRYAQLQALQWVEDESNHDTQFDRNFLRQEILPRLNGRWPDLPERTSKLVARQAEMLQTARLAEQAFLEACPPGRPLKLSHWLSVPEPAQSRLLSAWLAREADVRMPAPQLAQLVNALRAGHSVNTPVPRGFLRQWRGALHVVPKNEIEPDVLKGEWPLELVPGQDGAIKLPTGTLSWQWHTLQVHISESEASGWTVRYRRAGDKARYGIHQSNRPLKDWFQARGIPEWERGRVPLILRRGTIRFFGDKVLVDNDTGELPGWRVRWIPNATGHET